MSCSSSPPGALLWTRPIGWALVAVSMLAAAIGSRHSLADPVEPTTETKPFENQVRPLLTKYCIGCHGPATQEAKLRLDQLAPTFDAAPAARWRRVLELVELNQMPPKSEPRPTAEDARVLTTWIKDELRKMELAHRAKEGRVVLRRLNRAEYANTVRDLLGVDVDLKD